ncbi:MAG: OmpA family protein [Leptospirales bacterium]|nr:OmpA family protein [Leptospirales bacterium]
MKRIALICTLLATVFMLACETAQVQSVGSPGVIALNKSLEQVSIGGFGYKDSEVPSWQYDNWAKVSAPLVQETLTQVPDGYVLQITGHADSSGPEQPVGSKPGNIKISTDRAKNVHGALQKHGITSDKLTYKGVGSSQPLAGVAGTDAKQRRVSFVVVPK